MKSAAEPVGFAVFLGFIVLFPVFAQSVVPLDRLAERVDIVLTLRRALGFLTSTMLAVQPFDEGRVRLVAVLAFGVILPALLMTVPRFCHVRPRAFDVDRNRHRAVRIPMTGKGKANTRAVLVSPDHVSSFRRLDA